MLVIVVLVMLDICLRRLNSYESCCYCRKDGMCYKSANVYGNSIDFFSAKSNSSITKNRESETCIETLNLNVGCCRSIRLRQHKQWNEKMQQQ